MPGIKAGAGSKYVTMSSRYMTPAHPSIILIVGAWGRFMSSNTLREMERSV